MDNEAKKSQTITREREAIPLVWDRKEEAYMPAPYTGKKQEDTASTPTPWNDRLPGYSYSSSRTLREVPDTPTKDVETDYKLIVSACVIIGAMGMGILIVRTLYSFSPFLTVLMTGSGLLYAFMPQSKSEREHEPRGAEPKVPRDLPRNHSHEEDEVTIFYYKSKKIRKS